MLVGHERKPIVISMSAIPRFKGEEAQAGLMEHDAMQRWIDAYEAQADGLIRFATMMVGSASAEDIVSDAMIRVLDRPETARLHQDELAPYLFRAVANTAKNHLRSSRRRRQREEAVAREPHPASRDTMIDPSVSHAIAALSPQQRAVIFLTYWSDLHPTAVADHLGVSAGTVKRQLARARTTLGKALAR